MSRYCLSINIRTDNRKLLDTLIVTLESVRGNLAEIRTIEMVTTDESDASPYLCYGNTTAEEETPGLMLESWLSPEIQQ